MTPKLPEFEKPAVHQPVVKELRDISSNALGQLQGYLQQIPPQIPGRAVDGASPVDIYQDGVFVATVSAINFESATVTEDPVLGEETGGTGTGGTGGGIGASGGLGAAPVMMASVSATGPQTVTGEGAPTQNLPQGSLYLRTDGGPNTTLYVKTGPDVGDWTAK